ncbi:MAG: amidohydrolase family protein [Gammaproteobacteria bacterium]|nr:amidohydrolase family protein [Gammaproteobacteria bacterium]
MNDAVPALPDEIVDAHHHLWDLGAVHYPWLMARGVVRFFGDPTPIQRNYLVSDLIADAADLPLASSVHVQVGAADDQAVAETAWLQSVADAPGSAGFPQAIVAFVDLAAADAAAQIDAHEAFKNLRGVRQIVGRADAEDAQTGSGALLEDARWCGHLKELASRGLSFDLQLTPPQAARAATVLAKFDDTRIAICHCGSPWDQSSEGLAHWRRGMAALAERPNTYCKLSGFGMFDPTWTKGSIEPIVHSVIELFGPERCMFGSNFPVDKLYRGYVEIWETFAQLTTGFSHAERWALFSGTAREFYRLD